ncbi:TPA: hypothetical protein DEP96_01040 [Candidatus Uhrbacteria bacterium]|nr:hypothetical protein [Candidatus Uhrbacteria bacterium]
MTALSVASPFIVNFTPWWKKLKQLKKYPGLTQDDIDFARAQTDEIMMKHDLDNARKTQPFLDIVYTVHRATVPATLIYLRDRMKDAHGSQFWQWDAAYAEGVDDKRVKLIPGSPEFIPNRVIAQLIDFGANWEPVNGLVCSQVQAKQANQAEKLKRAKLLAGFGVLANAAQSKGWVRQMDGQRVPYALAAALLLNVPGYDEWSSTPRVCPFDGGACLDGDHVGSTFRQRAMPVCME